MEGVANHVNDRLEKSPTALSHPNSGRRQFDRLSIVLSIVVPPSIVLIDLCRPIWLGLSGCEGTYQTGTNS